MCDNVRVMERWDRENGVTEIAHSNGMRKETDRWLVVRRVLDKAKEVNLVLHIKFYMPAVYRLHDNNMLFLSLTVCAPFAVQT